MKVGHLSGTLNLGILVIQMLRNATTFGNNNIHYDTFCPFFPSFLSSLEAVIIVVISVCVCVCVCVCV